MSEFATYLNLHVLAHFINCFHLNLSTWSTHLGHCLHKPSSEHQPKWIKNKHQVGIQLSSTSACLASARSWIWFLVKKERITRQLLWKQEKTHWWDNRRLYDYPEKNVVFFPHKQYWGNWISMLPKVRSLILYQDPLLKNGSKAQIDLWNTGRKHRANTWIMGTSKTSWLGLP